MIFSDRSYIIAGKSVLGRKLNYSRCVRVRIIDPHQTTGRRRKPHSPCPVDMQVGNYVAWKTVIRVENGKFSVPVPSQAALVKTDPQVSILIFGKSRGGPAFWESIGGCKSMNLA